MKAELLDDLMEDVLAEALCPKVRDARARGLEPPVVAHGHHSDARRLLEHPRLAALLAAGLVAESKR